MAQLPSGRHVALMATPLFALIADSLRENAVITRLLRIERIEHLHPHVDVMYFLGRDGAAAVEAAPGGLAVPEGLQPYPSGFTLASIATELVAWPALDRLAFAEYLASERVRDHFEALLDEVRRTRRQIADHGTFELRMQVLTWQADCHPVRAGDTHDPMFDRLEDPYDPNAGC